MISVAPTNLFTTQLRDRIAYGEKINRQVLMKTDQHQVMLTCVPAGTQLPEHASSHDSLMTVLEGYGVFTLNGEAIALEPGVFIAMPANTPHALQAIENLAFLKVVEPHECSEHRFM